MNWYSRFPGQFAWITDHLFYRNILQKYYLILEPSVEQCPPDSVWNASNCHQKHASNFANRKIQHFLCWTHQHGGASNNFLKKNEYLKLSVNPTWIANLQFIGERQQLHCRLTRHLISPVFRSLSSMGLFLMVAMNKRLFWTNQKFRLDLFILIEGHRKC